ncbi:MAG: chromate efflux transporter [Alphaproteobacteria bacterium]|nr:chromate efflux transporter [Alphaproteobacteria bacterium]
MTTMPDANAPAFPDRPSFGEAFVYWLKLGCLSFGGPAGQIAMMQTDLVDRHKWIGQGPFLRGLSFATLLPGPEAQQLATYIGWRLHGTWGGIVAGGLFVLPGALAMLILSWIAAHYGDTKWVGAVFDGLKPVVVAIVAHAVWRIGKKALTTWQATALAGFAFGALHFAGIDFPWVVAIAAALGAFASRWGNFFAPAGHAATPGEAGELPRNGAARIAKLVALFVVLWAIPVYAVVAIFGAYPFADLAELMTKAAFVTFGGAYAVLPYIADASVNLYGWLSADDMLNGLALAESTPGPLILVLQYVGFYAGWNGGAADPATAAVAGAFLATYCTFLPSFLFILAGAPYVEGLHANKAVSAALAAITAAIVGVILNLAVFLGQEVFLPKTGPDLIAIAVAAIAFVVSVRFNPPIHYLVAGGALYGVVRMLAGL